MSDTPYFIIDFDSTFIQVEALEALAEISLKGNKDKDHIIAQIQVLTDKGIEGEISFTDGLQQRLALIQANRKPFGSFGKAPQKEGFRLHLAQQEVF